MVYTELDDLAGPRAAGRRACMTRRTLGEEGGMKLRWWHPGLRFATSLVVPLMTLSAVMAALLVATAAGSGAATPTNDAIVAAATAYPDGSTVGDGQCWTFMHQVVLTASSGTMSVGQNNDYYGSYTAVGGQLIARDASQPGDIIQLYNPANHQDASHVHTAIVLSHAAGSNSFGVIDENYHLNGKVLRHTWDPYADAARHSGWAVAIWRLGTVAGGTSDSAAVLFDFNANGDSYGDLVNIVGSTVQTWIGRGNGLYDVVTQNTASTAGTWFPAWVGNDNYGDLVNVVGSTVQTWLGRGNGLYDVVTQNTSSTAGTWIG